MKLKGLVPNLKFPEHLKVPTTIPCVVEPVKRKYLFAPIVFEGVRIYWRDDLFKLTYENLNRMKEGLAPVGKDGQKMSLHHLTQSNNTALCMMLKSVHTEKHGKVLHGIYPANIEPELQGWHSFASKILKLALPAHEPVNRDEFMVWRSDFWRFFYQQLSIQAEKQDIHIPENLTVKKSETKKERQQTGLNLVSKKSNVPLHQLISNLKINIGTLRSQLAQETLTEAEKGKLKEEVQNLQALLIELSEDLEVSKKANKQTKTTGIQLDFEV